MKLRLAAYGLKELFVAALFLGSASGVAAAPLKIAILLPGSVADNGYNADGGRAADALRKALGADTQVTENVSVANQADLYRQYAATGANLVVGWGGQFTDGAVQVSQEFPEAKFLVVNASAKNGSNLASLDTDIEQWEFLGGFVSAKISKSGVIGWIGGQCFPATAANLHGVEQGAKYANPNIKVISTFTGDFEDPTKAQQATQAMLASGHTDAVTGNLNNGWFGVFKAAESGNKAAVITEWSDNRSLAPDVIRSSILKSQAAFVVQIAKAVIDGSFKAQHYQYNLTPSWGPAIAKGSLPDDVYNEALALQARIVSGDVKPRHDESCPNN